MVGGRKVNTKRLILIVLAVALSAIVAVGAYTSYWTQTHPLPKADLSVKLVYAYIGHPTLSANTTGLDYSIPQTNTVYRLASYVVILKVTNNAAQDASITDIRLFVAPNIKVHDAFFTQPNGSPVPGPMGLPAVEISNALISEQRTPKSLAGWSNIWQPGDSRLVAITGVTSFGPWAEQYLLNGTLCMYGAVSGEPAYIAGTSGSSYDFRQVTFQNVGDGYLFNELVGKNQTLILDGLGAEVFPGQ